MIRILEAVEATHGSRNGVRPKATQRPGSVNHADVDAAGLEAELRATVRGEVRFDASTRAMYATDASNYRQVPIGLVIPKDAEDVERRPRCVPQVRRARVLARRRNESGGRSVQRGGGAWTSAST